MPSGARLRFIASAYWLSWLRRIAARRGSVEPEGRGGTCSTRRARPSSSATCLRVAVERCSPRGRGSEAPLTKRVADDIESRCLLGNEQDSLPRVQENPDDVRDGLALAGAGRPVHDEGLAGECRGDAGPLRRIRVEYQRHRLRRRLLVDVPLGDLVEGETLTDARTDAGTAESERLDRRVPGNQSLVVEEVTVHRLLREGEARQREVVGNCPVLVIGDRCADLIEEGPQVGLTGGVLSCFRSRESDAELVELECERRVDEGVVLSRLKSRQHFRSGGLQPYGNQEQWALVCGVVDVRPG